MKRKRPDSLSPAQPAAPAAPVLWDQPVFQTAKVILFSLLLLLSMTVQTGRMSVILLVLAVVLCVGRGPWRRFQQRLSVPLVGLLAYAFMNGFAAIYSNFGSYAVAEYTKFLASFALAVMVLVRFDRKNVRALLWGFAAVCAVIALLCVDMGSWGGFFYPFNDFLNHLGADFSSALENITTSRVNGIYNDANITGAILGPAILAAWYLIHTETVRWKRAIGCLLLGVSAVSFLIAVSRGAILCFCLAALVYLIAERERRLELFLLMAVTAIALAGAGGVAMLQMMDENPLPDIMCFACGAIVFLLNECISIGVVGYLKKHGLAVAIVCLGIFCLAGAAGVVALRTTEPFTFSESAGVLSRQLPAKAGTYTLQGEWSESAQVVITTRSLEQTLMARGRSTWLYSGPLDEAVFTVPEDAIRIFFSFRGEPGDTLTQVALSDGTEISLAYKWLPELIAVRLQDNLLQGNSFLLRVQYDKDGWKLFRQNMLLGYGMGSTEGLLTTVQPFFYESKYLHCHMLQVMVETGLVGFAFFLTFLLGGLWLLCRQVWRRRDPLAAMLVSCWVMLNAHSMMEINFSIRSFQCIAYFLLLLPVVLYAGPPEDAAAEAAPRAASLRKWGGLALLCGFCGYLVIFGALYEVHRSVVRTIDSFSTTSVREFMDTLEGCIERDVFDKEDNQLIYIANGMQLDSNLYNGTVQKYAAALRKSGTFPACSGVAICYYLPRGEFSEAIACYREGIWQEASAKDAWNLAFEFYRNRLLPAMGPDDMDVFAEGVLGTRDDMEAFNQGRMEEIELTEENAAFVDVLSQGVENGMYGETLYVFLTEVMGYGQSVS